MLTLKDVKTVLREHKIRPNKRLGQNFLIDKNVQEKIIGAISLSRPDVVLEIGPGLGALTPQLCKGAKKVIAIEKDKRLYEILKRGEGIRVQNLELIHGDILRYNFRIVTDGRVKVVGNLPYYISSRVLSHFLDNRDVIDTIFITVQKEFAERLTARPGTKTYGSISCFVQFYADPVVLFRIKKSAFYPSPKVDSCFLKIIPRHRGLCLTDEEKLFKIIRACFEKRRKTILNSLCSKGIFGSKEEGCKKLDEAGISPDRRPETVSLEEFVRITEAA